MARDVSETAALSTKDKSGIKGPEEPATSTYDHSAHARARLSPSVHTHRGQWQHEQLLVPVAYASGACPAMIHVGLDLPVAVQWQDLVGLVR